MKKGKLTVITGCMFSGKTTTLIERAEEAKASGKRIEVFYPVIDTRYKKDYITSHNALSHRSRALSLSVRKIENDNFNLVIIDEAHFFHLSLVSAVKKLQQQGVDIIAGGLDTDFRAQPFPTLFQLIHSADEVIELRAKCVICGRPANRTQRKTHDKQVILIGGTDMYEARCETCYVKPS